MKLIYQRKSRVDILKNCWYHRGWETWQRELQRNIGYEPLDEHKILAIENHDGNSFRPHDSGGLHRFGPEHIEKTLNKLNLKIDTHGLFYYFGRYRTWEQALSLPEKERTLHKE